MQRDLAERKLQKAQKACVIDDLKDENETLHEAIASLQLELDDKQESVSDTSENFSFETKTGRHYSPAIRKLYYTNQVPASRITDIIKSVLIFNLLCFIPTADILTLKLPKERCAGYMRRELSTISMAHKAQVLCQQIKTGKAFHLNSDGTAKQQRKLNGLAVNGLVLSVNEVPDGTAMTVIQDIEKELTKLRQAAHQLNVPNADAINWTLFASSTSDSAASQKKLNQLLQERMEDELKYGPFKENGMELVENFCAMHLGVNLRKAFVKGMLGAEDNDETSDPSAGRRYEPIDEFVHEFTKQFGAHGVPEYGAGVVEFPDFLELQATCTSENSSYYQECRNIRLERQIGSRYFVTAANAGRILFLAPAALDFLVFNGKSSTTGNKLEKDLYVKLQEQRLLAALKADALMFYFVFADLVTLAKSRELDKSAYDMSRHYLELKIFLGEVERYPEVTRDKDYQVFTRLYGASKLNHRNHFHQYVRSRLFHSDDWDNTLLLP